MKYQFKAGVLIPKKNKTIYFAKSQSNGLLIDDEINNIRYIINHNESIIFLFGNKRNIKLYDNRYAHIISDRVKRLFGLKHKYSDYKQFLNQ